MGCDIHLSIEEKTVHGHEWFELIHTGGIVRCYSLFATLNTDVRNSHEIAGIAATRGLPKDVSKATREAMEDLHSISWISVAEFKAWFPWTWETLNDPANGNFATLVYGLIKPFEFAYERRLVFGFDN